MWHEWLGKQTLFLLLIRCFIYTYTVDIAHAKKSVTYEAIHETKEYHEAEWFCEKRGGHLAKLTTREAKHHEDNQIYQILLQSKYECAWIGMSDRESEGTWRWFDGNHVSDKSINWGEQNALVFWATQFVFDCGQICLKETGIEWDMDICSYTRISICQYEREATTETRKTTTEDVNPSAKKSEMTEREATTETRKTTTEDVNRSAKKSEMTEREATTETRKTTTEDVNRSAKKSEMTVHATQNRVQIHHIFKGQKVIADQFNPKLKAKPDETRAASDVMECLCMCNDLDTCNLVNFSSTDGCSMYWESARAISIGAESVQGYSVWIRVKRLHVK